MPKFSRSKDSRKEADSKHLQDEPTDAKKYGQGSKSTASQYDTTSGASSSSVTRTSKQTSRDDTREDSHGLSDCPTHVRPTVAPSELIFSVKKKGTSGSCSSAGSLPSSSFVTIDDIFGQGHEGVYKGKEKIDHFKSEYRRLKFENDDLKIRLETEIMTIKVDLEAKNTKVIELSAAVETKDDEISNLTESLANKTSEVREQEENFKQAVVKNQEWEVEYTKLRDSVAKLKEKMKSKYNDLLVNYNQLKEEKEKQALLHSEEVAKREGAEQQLARAKSDLVTLELEHDEGFQIVVHSNKLKMEVEAAKKGFMSHLEKITQCIEEEDKAAKITQAEHRQMIKQLENNLKEQAVQSDIKLKEKEDTIEKVRNDYQTAQHWGITKTKEAEHHIKQLEDDKRDLNAKLEAVVSETTQKLENEHRQAMEILNTGNRKREDRIAELEEFINDQVTELDKMEAALKQTVVNKETLEKDFKELYAQTKVKDDKIQQLEDGIVMLTSQYKAILKDNTSREETKIKEKDHLIKQMEYDKRDLSIQLEGAGKETEIIRKTLEEKHQQLNDLEIQLAKALDPLKNIEELKEVVDLKEEIGRGAYGVVKKVSLHGTICAAKDIHAILVDYAIQQQFQALKKSFLEECIRSSKVFHPNIVQFLGIHYPSRDAKLPWLVMEKMDCSLTSFLKDRSRHDVSVNAKVSIIHDISLGLQYLHARDIIHRDLSSNNILLTKHLTAKIADLGVAKLVDPVGSKSHTLAPGTLFFLPPEATAARPQYGKPVDVFSLGCVMIHLMTHEWPEPAAETHYDATLKRKVVLSEVERRQTYMEKILRPARIKELILMCLHDSENERPVIAQVCVEVEKLL